MFATPRATSPARPPSELSDLLADARRDRLRAIHELAASPALAFALRRVLFTDRDALVRSAAARRLAALASPAPVSSAGLQPQIESWLLDALDDAAPLVRDAILRALADCGTGTAVRAVRRVIDTDRMWWIRRAAIYTLGVIAGTTELATLTSALADPFWRVRHAAVKVLAVLGKRDPDVRDEVLQVPASGTVTFLRSSWGPAPLDAPLRADSTRSELPIALLDPDPAVVTARVPTDPEVTPRALVELLCDPHAALRECAVRRLAEANDLDAFIAALDWLEEPRIPHVVDTVHHMLDDLGDPATEVAARALAIADRPGAARWAIGWVIAARYDGLHDAALERARCGDASVRRVALPLASDAELVRWAEPALVDAIAAELHDRRTIAAHDALLELDSAGHPRVRALQLDARARRRDWDAVVPALADPHHGPRAIAARWLVRSGHANPVALAADPDPAVREAALVPATAAHAAIHDLDPWVRRGALAILVTARTSDPAVAEAALAATDPWLRQQACRLPVANDRILVRVIAALGDRDPMVSAAARDTLEELADGDARIRTLLDSSLAESAGTRARAYGWLLRRLDDAAAELARDALTREIDPEVRALLEGVAGIEVPRAARPRITAAEPALPAPVAIDRRSFGRAGFAVAPLAISGAYDLPVRSLEAAEAAGVDLYFWEPGYDVLTQFLRPRGRRSHVITGTYHADRASIRADVDRALRTLRRDTLDAFLLFWTRSPARLGDEAFEVLDELRRAGKIRAAGFSTHHRDLARGALEARPWDVVMIRHSAAHPGIERELLPAARASNTAIVTFSALCYGRMLSGVHAPSPAECYRYSIAQPGVTACISAPRRHREAIENLSALSEPALDADRIAAMREHGAGVRAESQRFNSLLRQPTRDAAQAARELLAAELPPSDAEGMPRPLPSATSARRSRSRLGSPRRRS